MKQLAARVRALVSPAVLSVAVAVATAHAASAAEPTAFVRAPFSAAEPASDAIRMADFGDALPSSEVRFLADWVAVSRDHEGGAFLVIDKRDARLYVFDSQASLVASSAVLLGSARGDETVPGIGERPLALVMPHERTTPAGRFFAERGRNASIEDVVWVDYDAAVSLHRVRTHNAQERRLERLATPTPEDNRISYGCINVPVAFYEEFVRPVFAVRGAFVYVLPEVRTIQQVFGAYDMASTVARVGSARATSFRVRPDR